VIVRLLLTDDEPANPVDELTSSRVTVIVLTWPWC
jgi:hypothetical protein